MERSGSRQGQGQAPSGVWPNTAAVAPLGGRENRLHSGRESVPSEAVQLANITWDSFFAFLSINSFFAIVSGKLMFESPTGNSGYIGFFGMGAPCVWAPSSLQVYRTSKLLEMKV